MVAHSNAAILKAYADNTDLVVFILDSNSKWIRTNPKALMDYPDDEFFACLPQHNESNQCLHWLNGGDVLVKSKFVTSWEVVFHGQVWGDTIGWMREDAKYRIKPRKEKRWIAKIKGKSLLASNGLYKSIAEASSVCGDCDFYEIEVEV
jgi:hypothetical protein